MRIASIRLHLDVKALDMLVEISFFRETKRTVRASMPFLAAMHIALVLGEVTRACEYLGALGAGTTPRR